MIYYGTKGFNSTSAIWWPLRWTKLFWYSWDVQQTWKSIIVTGVVFFTGRIPIWSLLQWIHWCTEMLYNHFHFGMSTVKIAMKLRIWSQLHLEAYKRLAISFHRTATVEMIVFIYTRFHASLGTPAVCTVYINVFMPLKHANSKI